MSSLSPPSFIDDGHSFIHRTPRILDCTRIANWVTGNNSENHASAYTGSYYDDGADMLAASGRAPGLGTVDKRFYKQRKKKDVRDGAWNEDIGHAITGDISRSMNKIREARDIQVRKHDDARRGRTREGIEVQIPGKWGTFVIRDDNDRIIVVDEQGEEFDSGPRQDKKTSGKEKRRWVRARSSAKSHGERRDKKSRGRDPRDLEKPAPPLQELPRIPESEYEYQDRYISGSRAQVMSPTSCFMTGGASGWPSRDASPMASWTSSGRSHPKPLSSVHSSPGAWPSPPQSSTASRSHLSVGEVSDQQQWGAKRPHNPPASASSTGTWRDDFDIMSTNTTSTYRPPKVEDAPDNSSESTSAIIDDGKRSDGHSTRARNIYKKSHGTDREVSYATVKPHNHVGWSARIQNSPRSSPRSTSAKDNASWTTSETTSDAPLSTSVQIWIGGRAGNLSDASYRKSKSHKSRKSRHGASSRTHSNSHSSESTDTEEEQWDGFERPKSMSEVSVVGSERSDDWKRSTPSSDVSAASHFRSHRGRDNRARHRSVRSDYSARSDWNGSQKANVGGWDDGDTSTCTRDNSRERKNRAANRRTRNRYANGFDEDNETYLNATWDGIAVRVDSRRTSVTGWGN